MENLALVSTLLTAEAAALLAGIAGIVSWARSRVGRQAHRLEHFLIRQYETHLDNLNEMIRCETKALERLESSAQSMDERRRQRLAPLIQNCLRNITALQTAFDGALNPADLNALSLLAPPQDSASHEAPLRELVEVVRHFVPPEEHQQTIEALSRTAEARMAEERAKIEQTRLDLDDELRQTQKRVSEAAARQTEELLQSLAQPQSPEQARGLLDQACRQLQEVEPLLAQENLAEQDRAELERQAALVRAQLLLLQQRQGLMDKAHDLERSLDAARQSQENALRDLESIDREPEAPLAELSDMDNATEKLRQETERTVKRIDELSQAAQPSADSQAQILKLRRKKRRLEANLQRIRNFKDRRKKQPALSERDAVDGGLSAEAARTLDPERYGERRRAKRLAQQNAELKSALEEARARLEALTRAASTHERPFTPPSETRASATGGEADQTRHIRGRLDESKEEIKRKDSKIDALEEELEKMHKQYQRLSETLSAARAHLNEG